MVTSHGCRRQYLSVLLLTVNHHLPLASDPTSSLPTATMDVSTVAKTLDQGSLLNFMTVIASVGLDVTGPRKVSRIFWASGMVTLLSAFWYRGRRQQRKRRHRKEPLFGIDMLTPEGQSAEFE
jgi:hypothetical protein